MPATTCPECTPERMEKAGRPSAAVITFTALSGEALGTGEQTVSLPTWVVVVVTSVLAAIGVQGLRPARQPHQGCTSATEVIPYRHKDRSKLCR